MTVRDLFVRLHRWVGLALAAFLVVAGLTGSVIAFNHELDEWLNPDLFRTQTVGPTLDPLTLAARLEAEEPRLRVTYVPLETEPGHSLVLGLTGRIDPSTGQSWEPGYVQAFVDPVSGARLGQRVWGECCLARAQVIPFLYTLHYSLHLPGLWGWWLMGGVALAWMLDCFVGFYLTLPPPTRRPAAALVSPDARPSRGFWHRWKPAWMVRWDGGPLRINFDLHRAAGLWFFAVLLVVATSGAYLALTYEVFRPVLAAVTTVSPTPFDRDRVQAPVEAGVSLASAVATARSYGAARGWQPPYDVFHSPDFGVIGIGFGDHHAPGLGVPYLYLDAATGEMQSEKVPGEGTAADVAMQWMFPLHSGQALGLAGRILIALSGVAVAVLAVTGVVIWIRKRKGRQTLADRARTMSAPTRSAA